MKKFSKEKIPVFVIDSNLTEIEFFNRELDMVFVNKPITHSKGKILIACTNPFNHLSILNDSPRNSVIFFLLGNETYEVNRYTIFNSLPSINKVFIYNPPRPNHQIGLRSVIGLINDSPKALFKKKFYRNWKNAYDFALRSRNLKIDYKWSDFPQGYSKRFVVELELLGLISGSGSLFSNINLSEFIPKNGIGFVGQSGSWYRQELIKQFKKKPNFNYLESSGWGSSDAPVKPNYVKNIIENRVTLHLPGNVTNQTHRYMESLLLKRLPASPPFTFQDHHLTEYWTEFTHLRNCLSYRRLVNSILEMRDDEYSEILERERLKLQNRIKTIRGQVETFLS